MNFLLKVKEFFKKTWTAVKTAYQTKKWLGFVSAIIGVAVVATSIALPIALSGNNDENSNSSVPTESSSSLVGDSSSSETPDSSSSDPDHEHVYSSMEVNPTCSEKGYTLYVCDCGKNYKLNYVDTLPHTPVVDEAVEPTCTATGATEGSHCKICGTTIVPREPVKANGHVWGRWQETKPATENTKGEKRRDCNNCTEFETSPIAELSHSHDRYTVIILPAVEQNCTETGLTEGKKCSGCQEILVAQEVIPADGHNEVIDTAVPATCTETGLTEGKHCDVCHEVLVAQTTTPIDPTAHNYVNNVCTRCFDKKASEGLAYTLSNDGTHYSVSKGTCTDTDVVIPATYNNKPVKKISKEAFKNCDSLQSVIIPDSVQEIEDLAFAWCAALQSVTIGNNVQLIAYGAFGNCLSLQRITIPNSVQIIGNYAFFNCDSLQRITIPNSVQIIGDRAFKGCDSLQSVIIPDSVQFILAGAFSDCSNLQSVTLGNSVQSIGVNAFEGCDSLTSIKVSTSNTAYQSIDGNLYAKDGKTLVLYAIGKSATSFIIPDSVQSIGDHAFAWCESLQSVIIGDSVQSIGDWAFYGCTSLQSVTIPDSVQSIGYRAFEYCKSLQSVTIGDSVQSIGYRTFYNCESLQSVTIGDSVQTIERYAFEACDSLTEVTFENTEGWYVTKTVNATSGTDISSTDLANKSTAATYLKNTYCDYYWYRKTN